MEAISAVVLLLSWAAQASLGLEHTTATSRFTSMSLGSCLIMGYDAQCSSDYVKFYLYTSKNLVEAQNVAAASADNMNLTTSLFDKQHPTKIIIHGYNSNAQLEGLVDIKDGYLIKGDHNVFMVEWGDLCPAPCYPSAVYNARYVGRCTAELVRAITASGGSDPHLIGFSLGAQVTGFVANALRPHRLPRITGLDPALPLFLTPATDSKLDASDADFVDVVHTNALLQGQLQATGHLDFYMNGGINQPGCGQESNPSRCSHNRAPSYFAESIVSLVGFWGWPCESWFYYLIGSCVRQKPSQLMGAYANASARGVYYIETDRKPPYALGNEDDFKNATLAIFS